MSDATYQLGCRSTTIRRMTWLYAVLRNMPPAYHLRRVNAKYLWIACQWDNCGKSSRLRFAFQSASSGQIRTPRQHARDSELRKSLRVVLNGIHCGRQAVRPDRQFQKIPLPLSAPLRSLLSPGYHRGERWPQRRNGSRARSASRSTAKWRLGSARGAGLAGSTPA